MRLETNNTKQALWISIGSFFSSIIGIVSPMILSRYLVKEDYGTYKQVMYIYNTLLVVFTLGLPKAYSYFIPRVPNEEAKSLINKITRIFVLLGLSFSLILFSFAPLFAEYLNNKQLVSALRAFSVVPFLMLPTMGVEGVYAAFRKTQFMALYTVVTRTLTILLTIIPVVVFGGDYIDAIYGFDIACLITCVVALYMKTYPIRNVKSKSTTVEYKEIFSFSIPLLFASFWGIMMNSADQFFVSRYYGTVEFADFSNGFMELPFIGMILNSVAMVLLPVFSGMNSSGADNAEIFKVWNSTIDKSIKIIFPMAAYCICFASVIMVCLYGDAYVSSAPYFQFKNVVAFFIIVPFAPILLSIGKAKEYSYVHFVSALLVFGLEYICVKVCNSPYGIAVVSDFCQFVKTVLQLYVVLRVMNVSFLEVIPVKKMLLLLLVSFSAGVISNQLIDGFALGINKWFILFITLIVYILSYYFLCWIFKITYRPIAESIVKKDTFKSLLKYIP